MTKTSKLSVGEMFLDEKWFCHENKNIFLGLETKKVEETLKFNFPHKKV
jgi:hypothetical protein